MTKSRIKKSRKRAMLRGVDAMLDVVKGMLTRIQKNRIEDDLISEIVSMRYIRRIGV